MPNNVCRFFAIVLLLLAAPCVLGGGASGAHKFVFRVLSEEEGKKAFVDEAVEPYFSELQALEIAALTRSAARHVATDAQLSIMRGHARDQLQALVSSFSVEEARLLERIALRIDELLGVDFPLIVMQPWKLLKLDSRCCATAHTRGDSIILSTHGVEEMMLVWRESNNIDKVLAGRGSLLLHEQVHIVQRYHPELVATLYEKLWGFVHVAGVRGSSWAQKHLLHNPDAYDLGYLLVFDPVIGDAVPEKSYQLRTLLIPGDAVHPRMGEDFKSMAIRVEKSAQGWRDKLDESGMPVVVPFEDFTGFSHPLEGRAPQVALERGGDHPHEILAYSFEAILLHHYLAVPADNREDEEAMLRIRQAARLMFGAPLELK